MIDYAVILAGGFGTRLRSVVNDIPKALAPVGGKPFLFWLLSLLSARGVKRVLMLLGYGAKQISDYCGDGREWGLFIDYSVEDEPMDKGGALRFALDKIDASNFFFMNGDTFFDVDFSAMAKFHLERTSDLTIATRKWPSIDRTDPLEIDEKSRVISFGRKDLPPDHRGEWFINGGIYVVERELVEGLPCKRMSWEHELIPRFLNDGKALYAFSQDGKYFIDIGVPEDYHRAQESIPLACKNILKIGENI